MKKKSWWSRFLAKTPKCWIRVQKIAASLLAAMLAISTVSSAFPNLSTPDWFVKYGWYFVAVLVGIIAYSQSKELKK
jgi:hypothetical protein